MTPREEAAAKLGEAFLDLTEALRMNMQPQDLESMHTLVVEARERLEIERISESVADVKMA